MIFYATGRAGLGTRRRRRCPWLTGFRTGELRAVTWADLELEEGVLSVGLSVRDGGKLKTIMSPRRLGLTALAVTTLKDTS